ncbi:MAG: hypothetical protein DMF78_13825 [Acidobacteria bacterium]|nr:MAG: hypothetical protein DMF78_13825 [Acidobacteriota bacterium]
MRSIASAPFAAVALLAAVPATLTAAGSDPLVDRLVIIAPASLDGGWDQTARAMRSALLKSGLVGEVEVRNSPGAGGAVGLAQFVTGERGNGAALLVGGQVMVGAARTTHAAVSIADTTPIARLTGDYEVIAVPAGSELHDLDDLVQALRVQPGAVAWAGGSVGGSDQLLVNAFARAIGVDPVHMDYVPFTGGGEVAEALINHEVAVGVSGYGEFAARDRGPHPSAGHRGRETPARPGRPHAARAGRRRHARQLARSVRAARSPTSSVPAWPRSSPPWCVRRVGARRWPSTGGPTSTCPTPPSRGSWRASGPERHRCRTRAAPSARRSRARCGRARCGW